MDGEKTKGSPSVSINGHASKLKPVARVWVQWGPITPVLAHTFTAAPLQLMGPHSN